MGVQSLTAGRLYLPPIPTFPHAGGKVHGHHARERPNVLWRDVELRDEYRPSPSACRVSSAIHPPIPHR